MTVKTFREAYEVLQRHADTLRNQREPNIDDLLSIVTESIAAYQVCKERIEAVEKALEQALGSAGVESVGLTDNAGDRTEAGAAEGRTRFDEMDDVDDDPPF